MKLVRIESLEIYDWAEILQSSREEGHNMVRRLLEDFAAEINPFDLPGEALWIHPDAGAVTGVCGLNRETEKGFDQAGRIRRLYVVPGYRGKGIARSLLETVITFASEHYELLTVNVGQLAAGSFYEHLGFNPIEHPRITHTKVL